MSNRVAFAINMMHLETCIHDRKKTLKYLMRYLRVKDPKFREVSYQLWTCDSILHEIDVARKMPFYYTAEEILDDFSEKMAKFSEDSVILDSGYGFRVAAAEAAYLKEKYLKRKEAIRCGSSNDSKPG